MSSINILLSYDIFKAGLPGPPANGFVSLVTGNAGARTLRHMQYFVYDSVPERIKRSEEAILARVEDVRSKIDEKQVSLFSIFLLYPILVLCHIPQ